MRHFLLTLIALLAAGIAPAQERTVVVADAVTREPIAHASLYTKEQGRFRSCISDMQGRATIVFTFRRLTVSHLNYETTTVSRLGDTLLLKPRYRSTAEVVVTNREPEWIRRKLRRVVKTKRQHYAAHPDTMHFSYHTQSIGRNSLYRLHMAGLMATPGASDNRYAMRPDTCHITAADSTRLTDVANLRRMLYEDFVSELDGSFIANHKWGENPDFRGRSNDEVELHFRSKSRSDDRGRLVIDTARCVILEATRFTGTQSNRHERLSPVLYAMARAMSGYKITLWTRDYRVVYREHPDGTLYPAQVGYKMYFANTDGEETKQQREFQEQTGGGFPNMEATLTLTPAPESEKNQGTEAAPDSLLAASHSDFILLPPSWYLRLSSDADRERDIRLSSLPATFTLFGE